jgi:hypothetical protein
MKETCAPKRAFLHRHTNFRAEQLVQNLVFRFSRCCNWSPDEHSRGSYRHNRREHSKSFRCMYVMAEGPSANFDLLVAFGDQPSINFAGVVIGCFRLGELRL